MKFSGVVFDLDQTLVDSSCAEDARRRRAWSEVYRSIPLFKPYEGILDALVRIRSKKLSLFVVTSAPTTYCEKVLRHWNIAVDGAVCYHDTREHKPKPAPFLLALEKMNLPANLVPCFGDDWKDVQGAKLAGMPSYGCVWGAKDPARLKSAGPAAVLSSPNEIAGILN